MTAVLGVDLGTSQVKVLCRDLNGAVLGQGAVTYPINAPRDGWAESDPELWWRAVQSAIAAAAPAEVAAIALTGQMHGVVLCSKRTVVSRPAILWLDRRAGAEAECYRMLSPSRLAALGNMPWLGAAGPMLLWLREHEPSVYRAARWQLQPKDWLRFRMTGSADTDPSDASGTLLYDLPRDDWAWDVIEALGLRPDLFAPVHGSATVSGPLLPEIAAELGLPAGIPVVTGCSDIAASLLAARLPGPGWALLTLGTGGQWIMPLPVLGPVPGPDPTGNTTLVRTTDGLCRLGGSQNVGVALDWVRGVLGVTWDELYATASRPARDGLEFVPWLVSERGNEGGGGWTGMRLAHTREDLMRAALAGVAGLLRDRLADLRAVGCEPERVLIGGGGARVARWRDLLGEVFGLPLRPAATPWLTAYGATMLAEGAVPP